MFLSLWHKLTPPGPLQSQADHLEITNAPSLSTCDSSPPTHLLHLLLLHFSIFSPGLLHFLSVFDFATNHSTHLQFLPLLSNLYSPYFHPVSSSSSSSSCSYTSSVSPAIPVLPQYQGGAGQGCPLPGLAGVVPPWSSKDFPRRPGGSWLGGGPGHRVLPPIGKEELEEQQQQGLAALFQPGLSPCCTVAGAWPAGLNCGPRPPVWLCPCCWLHSWGRLCPIVLSDRGQRQSEHLDVLQSLSSLMVVNNMWSVTRKFIFLSCVCVCLLCVRVEANRSTTWKHNIEVFFFREPS